MKKSVYIAAAVVLFLVPEAQAESFRKVRFVKQISAYTLAGPVGAELDTQTEPHVAVDPNDPTRIVAVFQEGRFPTIGSAGAIGFATSHDSGKTWVTGELPGLTTIVGGPYDRISDPVVAVGPDGAVYAQTLFLRFATCETGIVVQRSDDGGQSFQAPVVVQSDTFCQTTFVLNDKNWIAVDTLPSSPYFGRIYSAWDQIGGSNAILIRSSDDRGATWSPPVDVSGPSGGIGVIPLIHPDGDLTLVYEAGNNVSQTSHDGGASFDPPVLIGAHLGSDPAGMRTGSFLLSAAADPVTGFLYAAWQDVRFRSDGRNDIVMSLSTDGGGSWAPVRFVNQDGKIRRFDHFTPAIAAHDGFVHVTYRTVQDRPNQVALRYIVSADGGLTFGRERRIGPLGNLDFAATADGADFLGDYMGLAATANSAHAVWCRPSKPRVKDSEQHQTTWSGEILR